MSGMGVLDRKTSMSYWVSAKRGGSVAGKIQSHVVGRGEKRQTQEQTLSVGSKYLKGGENHRSFGE